MLLSVADSDPVYANKDNSSMKTAMIMNLKNSGINKLVELYRPDNPIAVKAHSDLGLFYYRTGRYAEASAEMMFSVLTPLTRMANRLRSEDPNPSIQLSSILSGP